MLAVHCRCVLMTASNTAEREEQESIKTHCSFVWVACHEGVHPLSQVTLGALLAAS